MEEYRNSIIFACVAAYMLMCIGVGVWALRRTRSSQDFFMAGRNLGVIVIGLAMFSSTLSGFGFVGGPGLVYRMGMSSIWMVVCCSIGFCLSFYLLGKRLRLFAELRDPVSLPDAVAARYGSELSRFLTALAIILGVIGYLATQISAMSTVLYNLMQSSDSLNFISPGWCTVIAVAVLVFYCVTGGIIASVYTDLVQGAVMIVAAVFVFFTAMSAVDSGMSGITRTVIADDPESMGPWGSLGILGALSWYFLFAVGGAGQPHVITKMMMSRHVNDARYILPVTLASYAFAALLWIAIGLAIRALVLQGGHPELAHPDDAAAQFLQTYANPLLAGIVFAGLFAAIMSTADGFLNIGAAAFVHDIPTAIRGRKLSNELFWARTATLLIAIGAALFIQYSSTKLIAILGAFGWATFAAALVPTVAIGFNWKRATAAAANSAIVVSLLFNFSIKLLNIPIPFGIDPGALSLVVSILVFFTVSYLTPPQKIDPDIDALMDL